MNQGSLLPDPPAPAPLTDRMETGILPLINLVFLLLMFFLMVGVIEEDPLPDLPANSTEHSQEKPRVDFTIDQRGRLLNDSRTVALEHLPETLAEVRADAADPDAPWRLGAHQGLTMADLEEILAAFNRAGVDQVQLLTEPGA